jgi:peptidoglycan hydrolase-like protein with peptidoglycan-binding domain
MSVGARKSIQEKWKFEPVLMKNGTVPVPHAVGVIEKTACEPNKRDDVMLVQYLLKRVYEQGHNCNPQLGGNTWGDPHVSIAGLKIDGLYGPRTASAIQQFQLELRRNGNSIATDGRVDPEIGEEATSSISKTGYTISWLNKYFWVLYPTLAPDITLDPECPAELKQAIRNGSV